MKAAATLLARDSAGSIDLAEATQSSPNGIVSRAVVSSGGLRVTLFAFAAGQELTEHASSSRALVQILTGSSEWTVAGQPRSLKAGELLHLPPNTPHAVFAAEPFSMLLTLVREAAAPDSPSALASRGKPSP
jgi:quercetin dioxygenase-like cupin family protein